MGLGAGAGCACPQRPSARAGGANGAAVSRGPGCSRRRLRGPRASRAREAGRKPMRSAPGGGAPKPARASARAHDREACKESARSGLGKRRRADGGGPKVARRGAPAGAVSEAAPDGRAAGPSATAVGSPFKPADRPAMRVPASHSRQARRLRQPHPGLPANGGDLERPHTGRPRPQQGPLSQGRG